MKFSIVCTLVGQRDGQRAWDRETFIRELQAAERAGFYAAYTGERRGHGPASGQHGVTNNPLITCMYGLSHTTTLRFGTHVTLLPLHHPLTVIQDATMVNAFYPGRFMLGLGAGYTKEDFESYGVGLKERPGRMVEALEAINDYRSRRPHELAAPYKGSMPIPDPAMGDAFPELLVGAWSVAGVIRAARYGDGWFTGPIRTVEAEAELAAVYRAECTRLGKRPRVVLMREASIGRTDEEARDALGPYLLEYSRIYWKRGGAYDEKYEPWVSRVTSADELTLDMVAKDRYLLGSPDTWAKTLDEWQRRIQPDEVMLRLRYYYGPGLDAAIRAMEHIGRHIIPAFAKVGE